MAIHPQRTITAELRKWRRSANGVTGFIYNDINEVWEDGEEAFFTVKEYVESVNYYLAVTNTEVYKLPKDEELLNGV